jgi:hypothetical protein
MRSSKWLACLGPLALYAATLGCNPDPIINPNLTDGGVQAPAVINFVHAATDVQALDVYIDQQRQFAALAYHKNTRNQQITAAGHKVELRRAGEPATTPPLLTANLNLLPGSGTLLTVLGRASDAGGPSQLQLVASPYGTPDSKTVKLRLLNAAVATPAVSLFSGSNGLTDAVAFAGTSGYGSVPQLPVATKFGLRPARTTSDLAAVTLPAMATPGDVLTVIALGETDPLSDDQHFLAAAVVDEKSGALVELPLTINEGGPKGSLYLVHAAPGAPAVDVIIDKSGLSLTGLAYKDASKLVELAPGKYPVAVRPAGTMNTVLQANLKVLPGLHWTLIAHGLVTGGATPLRVTALPRPLDAQTSWRLANTVPDAPELALSPTDPPLTVTYGQASAVMATALPAPDFTVQLVGTPMLRWSIAVPQMVVDATQGQLVTVLATGTLKDAMKPLAVLAVLDNSATATMPAQVISLMATQAKLRGAAAR